MKSYSILINKSLYFSAKRALQNTLFKKKKIEDLIKNRT